MNLENLTDQYFSWLRSKTTTKQIDGWTEITTPYIDRHNDYIQIYVRKDKDEWILTDDGETLSDLALSGCTLDTPRRKALLQTTLNSFGMHMEDGAITVKSTDSQYPLRKHSLIQAMLSVNDLFYLARPNVENFFFEDVALWMDSQEIRYTAGLKFSGRTGFDHRFDFVVPKSKTQPERILRAINNPAKDPISTMIMSWEDTKETRPSDSIAFAILNDREKKIANEMVDALRNYHITPIAWSQREQYRDRLAA
jgi:hypothetical protein